MKELQIHYKVVLELSGPCPAGEFKFAAENLARWATNNGVGLRLRRPQ
jgi:hypothetical protein